MKGAREAAAVAAACAACCAIPILARMVLRLEGYVELPEHRGEGGFDHAAVHRELRRL